MRSFDLQPFASHEVAHTKLDDFLRGHAGEMSLDVRPGGHVRPSGSSRCSFSPRTGINARNC